MRRPRRLAVVVSVCILGAPALAQAAPAATPADPAAAAFGIQVQPRITFRLASSRAVRRKGLVVKGSIYPKHAALIQTKTSDGWQTVRSIAPSSSRFANTSSRRRGVLVDGRFLIR